MSEPITYTHRYPWTAEEVTIVTVLAAGAVATAVFAHAPLAAASLALVAAALIYLGWSRKKRSTLRATVTGTDVLVERPNDRATPSRGDLANVETVTVQNAGHRDPLIQFVSAPDEHGVTRSLFVPLRLARVMADLLAPVLRRAEVSGRARPFADTILGECQR